MLQTLSCDVDANKSTSIVSRSHPGHFPIAPRPFSYHFVLFDLEFIARQLVKQQQCACSSCCFDDGVLLLRMRGCCGEVFELATCNKETSVAGKNVCEWPSVLQESINRAALSDRIWWNSTPIFDESKENGDENRSSTSYDTRKTRFFKLFNSTAKIRR